MPDLGLISYLRQIQLNETNLRMVGLSLNMSKNMYLLPFLRADSTKESQASLSLRKARNLQQEEKKLINHVIKHINIGSFSFHLFLSFLFVFFDMSFRRKDV